MRQLIIYKTLGLLVNGAIRGDEAQLCKLVVRVHAAAEKTRLGTSDVGSRAHSREPFNVARTGSIAAGAKSRRDK